MPNTRTSGAIRVRARELRKQLTPAEESLWKHLRDRRLAGLKFRRQEPLGRYILDFYCHECRLAVEIDGAVHDTREREDRERTEWLEAQGIRVLRFCNSDVVNKLEGVLEEIVRVTGTVGI